MWTSLVRRRWKYSEWSLEWIQLRSWRNWFLEQRWHFFCPISRLTKSETSYWKCTINAAIRDSTFPPVLKISFCLTIKKSGMIIWRILNLFWEGSPWRGCKAQQTESQMFNWLQHWRRCWQKQYTSYTVYISVCSLRYIGPHYNSQKIRALWIQEQWAWSDLYWDHL